MMRLPDAYVNITVMNHPSTADAYAYVHGRGPEFHSDGSYRWDAPVAPIQKGEDWSEWLKASLQSIIDAL